MRTHPRRPRKTRRFGTLLAAALALTLTPSVADPLATPARADTADQPKVTHSADALTVSVPATKTTPGYTVDIATDALAVTTERAGETVLSTAGGDTGGLRFRSGGQWQHATEITDWAWQDGVLALTADT
ncbi:glycoside hydrolase, partial [Streptomyces sp. MCAF7]